MLHNVQLVLFNIVEIRSACITMNCANLRTYYLETKCLRGSLDRLHPPTYSLPIVLVGLPLSLLARMSPVLLGQGRCRQHRTVEQDVAQEVHHQLSLHDAQINPIIGAPHLLLPKLVCEYCKIREHLLEHRAYSQILNFHLALGGGLPYVSGVFRAHLRKHRHL